MSNPKRPAGTDETEAPQDLHGEFTEHGAAALKQLELLLTHRRHFRDLLADLRAETQLCERTERKFTGHLLLVPDHEQTALMVAITELVRDDVRRTQNVG